MWTRGVGSRRYCLKWEIRSSTNKRWVNRSLLSKISPHGRSSSGHLNVTLPFGQEASNRCILAEGAGVFYKQAARRVGVAGRNKPNKALVCIGSIFRESHTCFT
jgi:hypothetical protein